MVIPSNCYKIKNEEKIRVRSQHLAPRNLIYVSCKFRFIVGPVGSGAAG